MSHKKLALKKRRVFMVEEHDLSRFRHVFVFFTLANFF